MIPKKNEIENDIQQNSLKYLHNQERYLFISILFPIYSIIVQIVNMVYIIKILKRPPPPQHPPLPVFDIITPFIVFLMISLFALMKFIFLMLLRKKSKNVQNYFNGLDNQNQMKDNEEPREIPSLIKILYDLIKYMNIVRFLFLVINITFVFYLQWSIRFILTYLHLIPPGPLPPNLLFHVFNSISEFGLLIYMFFEWHHFLRWNKKMRKIENFEKLVFEEINLEKNK